MKIYVQAKSKSVTISRNKLYKGKFYVDKVGAIPLNIADISDNYYKHQVLTYAEARNIPIKELKKFEGEYIIDTQAAIDTAMLSDNEDLKDILVEPINSALREACKRIESDLIGYSDDDTIVMAYVKLTIFGYSGYNIVLEDEACPISPMFPSSKEKLNSVVCGITMLSAIDGDEYVLFADASKNNSEFQRRELRGIIKRLAEPIENLKKK